MKSSGRLLIIEMVLPAGDTPHPGKVLDIAMLVMPGGQERTEEEYGTLLSKAGFRLTRVVPLERKQHRQHANAVCLFAERQPNTALLTKLQPIEYYPIDEVMAQATDFIQGWQALAQRLKQCGG